MTALSRAGWCAVLIVLLAEPARAVVDATLDVLENGEPQQSFDSGELNCVDAGPGVTECAIEIVTVGNLTILDLALDLDADPEIAASFAVQNTSVDPQHVTLRITMAASVPAPTLTGGSAEFDFRDNIGDGATLAAPPGSALYTAMIDGSAHGTLFADPASGTAGWLADGTLGPESFGALIPSQAGPPVTSSVGIEIDFTLTGSTTPARRSREREQIE